MYLSKLLEADATVGQHNPSHGRHQQRVDHLRQGTWGQSSAYLRRGLSGSSYYQRDPHRQYGMERSRLGRQQFYGREVEDDEDDLDRDSGVGTRGGGGGGVKFNLPSRQRQQEQLRDSHYGHDSESSDYDRATEPIGGGTKATLASTLGDSFVSEIGGQNKSSSSSSKGMGQQGGGNYDTRSGDDMADSFENEQDSRKKGVFGLLNQIYEMNATNL